MNFLTFKGQEERLIGHLKGNQNGPTLVFLVEFTATNPLAVGRSKKYFKKEPHLKHLR
ncbi:MAG: hypothetical protein ACI9AV_001294 [Sediminicola sp.]|jgi:hypothetical protein|tara:strand:- start:225 stop:398 length:174 start_codon:yes stop_codon:yes gene_type:complete